MVHNGNYTKLWKQTMLKVTKSCSCPPEDKWLFKIATLEKVLQALL